MSQLLITQDYLDTKMFVMDTKMNLVLDELKKITNTTKPDDKLCRKDVARVYKLALSTVDKYSRIGILKKYKMGRRVLFIRSEVEQSIKENEKKY